MRGTSWRAVRSAAAVPLLLAAELMRRGFVSFVAPLLMAWESWRTGVAFELLSSRFRRDPVRAYSDLRERDPVHRSVLAGGWVLTRFEDVAAVMRDAEGFSSDPRWRPPPYGWGRSAELSVNDVPTPLRSDGQTHVEARRAFGTSLSPAQVETRRPSLEAFARELLGETPPDRPFDFVEAVARPLPLLVLLDLLGYPVDDLAFVQSRSDALARDMEPGRSVYDHRAARVAAAELEEYIGRMLDTLGWPFSGPVDGLSRDQQIALLGLVLAAGHETTSKLLGGGLHLILTADGGWRRFREQAADTPGLVQELQRLTSPVQLATRFPREQRDLEGRSLRRAQQISLALGGANRDAAVYACPHEIHPRREGPPHLAFGVGPHRCPGAELATLEAEVVFAEMFERYEDVRLAGEADYGDEILVRGPRRLPIVVTPAHRA